MAHQCLHSHSAEHQCSHSHSVEHQCSHSHSVEHQCSHSHNAVRDPSGECRSQPPPATYPVHKPPGKALWQVPPPPPAQTTHTASCKYMIQWTPLTAKSPHGGTRFVVSTRVSGSSASGALWPVQLCLRVPPAPLRQQAALQSLVSHWI